MEEKTYVEDVDRSVYDIRDEEHDAYRLEQTRIGFRKA